MRARLSIALFVIAVALAWWVVLREPGGEGERQPCKFRVPPAECER